MPALLESTTALSLEHEVALEHAPTRITTTLYDVLAALQDVAPADDDPQGSVSTVDIDGNNAFQIKAIGVIISTVETLPFLRHIQ